MRWSGATRAVLKRCDDDRRGCRGAHPGGSGPAEGRETGAHPWRAREYFFDALDAKSLWTFLGDVMNRIAEINAPSGALARV